MDLGPGKTVRVGKNRVGAEELDQIIQQREAEAEKLAARLEALPKHVPIEDVLEPGQIVQLERERKVLVDALKLTAYRAESSLASSSPSSRGTRTKRASS